jgi:hypothetical protein
MEADWGAEAGTDLPQIVVPWDGFVDLTLDPEAAAMLEETAERPALAQALRRLHASDSPLLTSKCDVWELTADEIDPYEFDCSGEDALTGIASYIDVIARDPSLFCSFARHEAWAAILVRSLRELPIRNGRVDVTIRSAEAAIPFLTGFGITLYSAGCGADSVSAAAAWEKVLEAAIAATIISGIRLANPACGSTQIRGE